jgi:molecular chaperone HscA
MHLLQIHEPGETPPPHDERLAVGIDLGTTHSVVAVARDGKAEAIRDADGSVLLPSVVWYGESREVGSRALARYRAGDGRAIASIKRWMGRDGNYSSIGETENPLPLGEGRVREKSRADNTLTPTLSQRERGPAPHSPVEISSHILRALRQRAEEALGQEVTEAVITVPAYFDDAARTATKDAARLAGLTVLRLINEPTAAALAYGLDSAAEGIYAIYDLGGGTFDLSILRLEKGVFQVLATGGDTRLGGDDVDEALAQLLVDSCQLPETHTRNSQLTTDNSQTLLSLARSAKETLSTQEEVVVAGVTLTRTQMESLAQPFIARTLAVCAQVVQDAQLTTAEIQGVVLVGGSTRMPLVRREVAGFFKQEPLTTVDPDLVVALGAALQAEALTRGSDTLLLDVTPLSLGLELMGGIVEKCIYRNTPIPVAVTQEFTTYQDGQTGLKLHIVQGEREKAEDCRSLARLELSGIPPMVAGAARVSVTFALDADGLLTVSAREETTGIQQEVQVKPSYGIDATEMERMLRDSMEHARADMTERLLIEARTEATRSLLALESALAQDGHLLSTTDRQAIDTARAAVQTCLQDGTREAILAASENLEKAVQPFAALRFRAGVESHFAGRSVEEIEATFLSHKG